MTYADKTLTCRDCGQTFTFSASEQQFFADRGFQNEPSRCPECRAARKATGGDRGRSFSGGRREMVDVTCSSCGKPTQVPFTPTEGRPVYCSDCFTRERASTRPSRY
ncbi:MAG TPA: zinc-ribbon domain containing protein [Chloroflexota bacterium]|jgi:CxxC-x17-CxxC domain-containing protein|nr:zinc-ribbon domain containing protein [Chloroflexota bacterium]